MTLQVKDKLLIQTKALSNGAGATAIDGFDLRHNAARYGRHLVDCELLIEMPLLTTTELPNSETYIMSIEHDSDPAFGTAVVLHANVQVQTGAGGAGAAAKSTRVRLPSDVKRYVRVKGTKTGTGNVSAKVMTVSLCY
jgi:hypothetical protein